MSSQFPDEPGTSVPPFGMPVQSGRLYPSPPDVPSPSPYGQPGTGAAADEPDGSPYRYAPGRKPRRRRGMRSLGCLGSLVALAVLVLGIQVVATPWAFHLGGSFTPSMSWTGVAEGTAPHGGGAFALQLQVSANTISDRNCSSHGCDDVHGKVSICTAAGEFSFKDVDGNVGGYTSTDGKKMMIDIDHGTVPADQYMQFVLTGVWHGGVYQANDEGFLVRGFDSAGKPRATVGPEQQANAVSLDFRPGSFTSLCAQVRK